MLGIEPRAARFTWSAAVILLLLLTVFIIRQTLVVFTVSLLFAYLLYPMVDRLNRFLPSRSRTPALAIVYLVLIAVIVLLGFQIGGRAAEEANNLNQKYPEFVKRVKEQPKQPENGSFKNTVFNAIQAQIREHYDQIASFMPKAGLEVLSASRNLIFLVIVPILSFFILKDGRQIRDDLLSLIDDGPRRELFQDILADIHLLLLQYMRALSLLCLATFVVFTIVFSSIGVPYGILLASIAFPLEFIPLVGPLCAAAIIITVTAFSGYPHVMWIVVFLGGFRVFQDYVLSPRLMSSGVELHPLLVIFGVFAGGEIGGVAGTFLSVPVLALIRVLYFRIRKSRIAAAPSVLAA